MSFSWIGIMLLSGNDEQLGIDMYFVRKIAKGHNLWVFTHKCWQIFAGGGEREIIIQRNTIFYYLSTHYCPPKKNFTLNKFMNSGFNFEINSSLVISVTAQTLLGIGI